MDKLLISKILIGQITDLVEKQKTVSPDELAEDIVNSCCYFILKRRKDVIAANPSPIIMFESISDSINLLEK